MPLVQRFALATGAGVSLLYVLERGAPEAVHGQHHLQSVSEAEAYLAGLAADLQARVKGPVAIAHLGLRYVEGMVSGIRHPASTLAGKRVVAASGIADPDAFVAQTKATGAALVYRTVTPPPVRAYHHLKSLIDDGMHAQAAPEALPLRSGAQQSTEQFRHRRLAAPRSCRRRRLVGFPCRGRRGSRRRSLGGWRPFPRGERAVCLRPAAEPRSIS